MWGETSKSRIATVHFDLQLLCQHIEDHSLSATVLCGRRGRLNQHKAFQDGTSKVDWPFSKHNCVDPNDPKCEDLNGLSEAIDIAPWWLGGRGGIPWPENARSLKAELRRWKEWYMFMGIIKGISLEMGLRLRFGFDWDGDLSIKDQNFHDLPHIERLPD